MKTGRLLFNLRPTTHEFMHLVMRGHFWSCDKDGGHTIQPIAVENAMIYADLVVLSVIELELWEIEVLHCENRDFWLFAPGTFTRWPSYTNSTRIPWRYTGCADMNFVHQSFQKLSSDVHTYRQTPPKLYTMPLCMWSEIHFYPAMAMRS